MKTIKKLFESIKEAISTLDGHDYKIVAGSDEAKSRRKGSPGRIRLNEISVAMFNKPFNKLSYAEKDKVMSVMDKEV